MSKALEASCVAGIVKVGQTPVPGATLLSEGIAPSEGILILEEDKATYLAKTSPDLKTTLDKVSSAITKISTILTSIGAAMTGPTTAPPPTLVSDVAELLATNVELIALKSSLK